MPNSSLDIGVLTYDRPMRKTQDVLLRLKCKGYENVTVYEAPFIERPIHKPLVQHRAMSPIDIDNMAYAGMFGYLVRTLYSKYNYMDILNEAFDCALIGAARIIPEEVTKKKTIINSHPGHMPRVRGLDALKWAIFEGKPLSVTTHVIDGEIDAGLMIDQRTVPAYPLDTYHSIEARAYEMEVDMLVEAIEKRYESKTKMEGGRVRRRMPHWLEVLMLRRLEERLAESGDMGFLV